MRMCRRHLIASAASGLVLAGKAKAQPRPVIKIAVLTDLSGPYRDIAGEGSIASTRQAAAEFAASSTLPFDIQVVSADHRNDVARATSLAAHFYDREGVDLIIDVPNSAVALAVNGVAQEKAKAYINCGAGAGQLTGSACSPYTIHWSYDTNMLARSTGGAFTHAGGATWFFITADYMFGHQMEQETTTYVIAAGGRIEGSAAYPFPGTTDFTPFLRQAEQSGASVPGPGQCRHGYHRLRARGTHNRPDGPDARGLPADAIAGCASAWPGDRRRPAVDRKFLTGIPTHAAALSPNV